MTHRTVIGLPSPSTLEPDSRIGDRLVVRRVIGRGASATVYEAEHTEVGSAVAVKVVHASAEPHHLARFRREAQICGRVRSPHVPQVYDVGQLEDGSPYLVMELLEGDTLDSHIARGPLPFEHVFEIGHQLLCALEAVHDQRAIHRDVKPENLLLTWDAAGTLSLKLVDFGISKSLDETRHVTLQGMVLGTPHYMAPEQVEGLPLDERVDIHAVGAVMYEMITGRTPFSGRTADEVMTAVQRDPIIPAAVLRDGCPMLLDALVVRAMSRSPDDRFPNVRAMRFALEEAREEAERQSLPTPLVRRRDRLATVPPPPALPDETHDTVRVGPPFFVDVDDPPEAVDPPERGAARWAVAAGATLLVLGGMAAATTIVGLAPPDDPFAQEAEPSSEVHPGPPELPEPTPSLDPEPPAEPHLELAPEPDEGIASAVSADDSIATDAPSEPEVAATEPRAEEDEDRSRDRPRARARRHAPVTTVMPRRATPDELRMQLRERVREAMLRQWPEDGDHAPSDEDDRHDLPPLMRDNPYEASPAAFTDDDAPRERRPEDPFEAASP